MKTITEVYERTGRPRRLSPGPTVQVKCLITIWKTAQAEGDDKIFKKA